MRVPVGRRARPTRCQRADAFTLIELLVVIGILAAKSALAGVPSLDELAGEWQDAASVRSLPALAGGAGAAQCARDVLAINNVSFPPLTMSFDSGALLINSKKTKLERTRWFPYQVARAGSAGSLGVETYVRMPYEKPGLLFHILLTNRADELQSFELKIHLNATTSRYQRWGWGVPREKSTDRFSAVANADGRTLSLKDSRGELANCFGFARKPDQLLAQKGGGLAVWQLKLPAHGSATVDYVLAFGEKDADVALLAGKWAGHFDDVFAQVKTDWQKRFDAMFTPGNRYFSGHLPTLVTRDEQLRKVYYVSAVSLLSVCRTTFPLAPRVYVSNAPECNGIMEYFWDMREFATTVALLDPVMLKQYLRGWLAKDIYKGYAQEFLTGTLEGPWYSANDFSVFILLNAYLNVTDDRAFLGETINGQTVAERMTAIATNWKRLVKPGRTLADYGEAPNLLECVPTYIHEVPSFNAANVWMMRRVAAIDEAQGNSAAAAELRAEADRLLPAVLALYEPGQGVWDSLHRDGTRVQMRHVFDFATIGLTIKDDLTPQTRSEMVAFVERELLTDHWMRAQSLSDPAADKSDRPDHGPMGAFSSWPAETLLVLCEFGEYGKALDFIHRIAAVTEEGPFSQSRELMGKTPDAPVRIATRGMQTYNASNGSSFMEAVICGFFGYQPDFLKPKLTLSSARRGFEGSLLNIHQGGHQWNIHINGDAQHLKSAD